MKPSESHQDQYKANHLPIQREQGIKFTDPGEAEAFADSLERKCNLNHHPNNILLNEVSNEWTNISDSNETSKLEPDECKAPGYEKNP